MINVKIILRKKLKNKRGRLNKFYKNQMSQKVYNSKKTKN